ncbi:hypothetical protein [Cerasicoccus frondis]|uniref:hypothetical protein n=1 Tax=Cerasicoccus frondis TaxID=490090 RepID=UPI0028526604|nr:hypothetical protein [Cerasicoccus frondis]
MQVYHANVPDRALAKELSDITSAYQDSLIEVLDKSKEALSEDEHRELALVVGHVLATLGSSIFFPIYRQHPELAPNALKDIFDKQDKSDDQNC